MFSGRRFGVQACRRHVLATARALVLTLVLGAIGAGWAQAAAVGSGHAAAHRGGSLSIVVAYLPSGIRATAMLHGPAGPRSLARTTRLRRAPPGNYTLTARPVNAGNRTYYPTVARCAVVAECPSLPHGRASLKPGAHLTLHVDYYDVVSNSTDVLSHSVLRRMRGDLRANGTLIFTGTAPLHLSPGSVIVSPPSTVLPYGAFRKVLRVTAAGGETVVATAPATLVEAVPRGAFTFGAAGSVAHASSPGAHAADVSFSFPNSPISCGPSGGAISLSASASFAEPHWNFSAEWDGNSTPKVSLSGTLGGTVSTSLSAAASASCNASWDFPASDSANPGYVGPMFETIVGGVPVWLTPELVGTATVKGTVSAAVSESATEILGVTAGISYDSTGLHPILTPTRTLLSDNESPGSGEIGAAVGGKLYLDLENQRLVACKFLHDCDDTLGVPSVELTGGLTFKSDTTLQPWWRLDAELTSDIGLDIPLLHLNLSTEDYPLGVFPIIAPPGTPRELTATPEDEAATISWQPPPANPADPPQKDEKPCACLPVTGYNVYENGVLTTSTVGTSVRLTGLTNGTTYKITVRANSAKDYVYSQETAPVPVTPEGEADATGPTGGTGPTGATDAYPVSFTATANIPVNYPNEVYGGEVTVTGVQAADCNSPSYTQSFCPYKFTGVTGTLYGGSSYDREPYNFYEDFVPCSASAQEYLNEVLPGQKDGEFYGSVELGSPPDGNGGIALVVTAGDPSFDQFCQAGIGIASPGDFPRESLTDLSSPWVPGSLTSSWTVTGPAGGESLEGEAGIIVIDWQY